MNMIICDKQCRHQQDGYCALNRVTSLSQSLHEKCGYFEAGVPGSGYHGMYTNPDPSFYPEFWR
ncbi:MAG: hypothetical protein FWH02_05300 [Oscillospiraceae bacterium]|nr:hypothetical protein [Oscillospiraceae bacterium]